MQWQYQLPHSTNCSGAGYHSPAQPAGPVRAGQQQQQQHHPQHQQLLQPAQRDGSASSSALYSPRAPLRPLPDGGRMRPPPLLPVNAKRRAVEKDGKAQRSDASPAAETAEADADIAVSPLPFIPLRPASVASSSSSSSRPAPPPPPACLPLSSSRALLPHSQRIASPAAASPSLGSYTRVPTPYSSSLSLCGPASSPHRSPAQHEQQEAAPRPPSAASAQEPAAAASHAPFAAVYMAVLKQGRRANTAIAYYSAEEGVLYCGEFPDWSMVEHLKHALLPVVILTAEQPDSGEFASLQRNELDLQSPFTVRSLKPSDFSHAQALSLLRDIHLTSLPPSERQRLDRFSHHMQARSLLDMDNQLLTACVAPLLDHIVNTQRAAAASASCSVSRSAPASGGRRLQLEIRLIPSTSVVHVDAQTARALSIFREEGRPQAAGGARDGSSSVYGLLNRTVSGVGAKVLRGWLQWPSADMAVLQARLDAVEFFTQPRGLDAIADICSSLKRVKDVSLCHLMRVHDLVSELPSSFPLASQFQPLLDPRIRLLFNRLYEIVELSKGDSNRVGVRRGVDERVDKVKQQLAELPAYLSRLEEEDAAAGCMQGAPFTYRYVQPMGFFVRLRLDWNVDLNREGLRLAFTQDDCGFYKSERTAELDDTFGDIAGTLCELEDGIVRELQSTVAELSAPISALSRRVYELDGHIALAQAANELGLVRPVLSTDNVLHITAGRHLLHANCLQRFIPNDTKLGEEGRKGGQLHVITGPNGSGKTVYLQQVGIIAYLAVCGCFVPAASAVVGLLDALYSCLVTTESVSSDMSAFCQEASRIAFMQRHATGRSLCLLDEFGKGTTSDDGVALLAATLRHWETGRDRCPKAVVSTHLHDVFTYGLLTVSPYLQAFRMSFHDESQSAAAPSSPPLSTASSCRTDAMHAPPAVTIPSITPLFTLVPGLCTDSYALCCAERAGLPPALLHRAASVSASFSAGQQVSAWRAVMEEREGEEEEGRRRVWARFQALVSAGLEEAKDDEITQFALSLSLDDSEVEEAQRAGAAQQAEQQQRQHSVSDTRMRPLTSTDAAHSD